MGLLYVGSRFCLAKQERCFSINRFKQREMCQFKGTKMKKSVDNGKFYKRVIRNRACSSSLRYMKVAAFEINLLLFTEGE